MPTAGEINGEKKAFIKLRSIRVAQERVGHKNFLFGLKIAEV